MNSNDKRYEYWDYFVSVFFVEKIGGGNGVTGTRLMKMQNSILSDDAFWFDVIDRHGGSGQTPRQMKQDDEETYNHCLGNFWGMINQEMIIRRMIK